MDFTGEQVVFFLLIASAALTLWLWFEHERKKKKQLALTEQTTYETWMDYDNKPPEDIDTYKGLREQFLENYLWAVDLFGSNWDLKENDPNSYLDDRLMFNYHIVFHMYEYYRYLPTCFRPTEFESVVYKKKGKAYGTKGAEDYMEEFNAKVKGLKEYATKHALEIKYGVSLQFPKKAMVNCLLLCDGQSYYEYQFKIKSQLREKLLKEGFNVREFIVQNYSQGG